MFKVSAYRMLSRTNNSASFKQNTGGRIMRYLIRVFVALFQLHANVRSRLLASYFTRERRTPRATDNGLNNKACIIKINYSPVIYTGRIRAKRTALNGNRIGKKISTQLTLSVFTERASHWEGK